MILIKRCENCKKLKFTWTVKYPKIYVQQIKQIITDNGETKTMQAHAVGKDRNDAEQRAKLSMTQKGHKDVKVKSVKEIAKDQYNDDAHYIDNEVLNERTETVKPKKIPGSPRELQRIQ